MYSTRHYEIVVSFQLRVEYVQVTCAFSADRAADSGTYSTRQHEFLVWFLVVMTELFWMYVVVSYKKKAKWKASFPSELSESELSVSLSSKIRCRKRISRRHVYLVLSPLRVNINEFLHDCVVLSVSSEIGKKRNCERFFWNCPLRCLQKCFVVKVIEIYHCVNLVHNGYWCQFTFVGDKLAF